MNNNLKKIFKYFFILIILGGYFVVNASVTDGTIDLNNKTSLLCLNDSCSTTSRINFLTTKGNTVHITDSLMTGNAWSETMGWINLNPTNRGVTNTSSGVLGGYAWGDNAGWINFAPTKGGVTINEEGEFYGYAWAENYGWIKFDCAVSNACVKTDWRPASARSSDNTTSGSTSVVNNFVPVVEDKLLEEEKIEDDVNPKEEEDMIEAPLPQEEIFEDGPIFKEDYSTPKNNNSNKEGKSFFNTIKELGEIVLGFVSEVFDPQNIVDSFGSFSDIMDTEAGRIAVGVATTAGMIAGVYFSFTTSLFANPLSLSEILLIPARLWGLLLVAFGLKKRNRPWGTVYDSITKQPLDPAYVVLSDLEGKEISTCITDLDGRYGFLVPPGIYRMSSGKTNYEFPSKKLLGKVRDELYDDLYFNEIIEVKEGDVISKNIPMDPIKFDWNEFAKKDQKLMKFFSSRDLWVSRISNFLFVLGFAITIVAVTTSPVLYNILILILYLVLFVFKNTILRPRPFGRVKDKNSNNPFSFAIMRIFFANENQEVSHKVTDRIGKYYCLIPNGNYYVKIENKNSDETYSHVFTSENIEVKNGYINKIFKI